MELKLDQWATTPPAGYPGTVSPPPGKRAAGFTNGEEAPAGYFNHAWDALSDTQNELANLITGAGLTRSETNLAQVLGAIQTLIGRAQLKTALTTVRAIQDTTAGLTGTLNALARAPYTPSLGYKGQAVVVGTAGTIYMNGGWQSPSFQQRLPDLSYSGDLVDITWDPTLQMFIAVGKTGEIQTSNGSSTWTRRATGGNDFRKVTTNGLGRCVAVGNAVAGGGLIKYSTDGVTWNTATEPFGGAVADITGLAFGAGLFVIANLRGAIASSPDGITWTVRRAYSGAAGYGNVVYDPSLGFLCSVPDTDVFWSVDGIAWNKVLDSLTIISNNLGISPYGWIAMRGSVGTSAEVRYNPSAVEQPPDFTVDVMISDQLTWLKFIDGQLWALGGKKIYLGGVL